MALILGIETSTDTCSVAIGSNGIVLKEMNNFEGNKHASLLHPMVKDLLQETGYKLSDLDAIAISKGPGSYTGLRVGVSAAKGYGYALQIPIIGINSLVSLTQKFTLENSSDANLFVPMIDARRMEVYTATYDKELKEVQEIRALIVDEQSFSHIPDNIKVAFIGNGSSKCSNVMARTNFSFIPYPCGAAGLIRPAEQSYQEKQFENTAYFEPFYLKEFVGTQPSKK